MWLPLFLSVTFLIIPFCHSTTYEAPVVLDDRISIVSISSNNTCVDEYPAVWNCTLPSAWTIQVNGLFSGTPEPPVEWEGVFLSLSAPDRGVPYRSPVTSHVWRLTAHPTAGWSTLRMQIDTSWAYHGLPLMGVGSLVATVSTMWYTGTPWVHRYSPAFTGVSLFLPPTAILTSISGCEGSGSGTYHCNPLHDTLILRGGGLSLFEGHTVAIQLNTFRREGSGRRWDVDNICLQVVHDGLALLPLKISYGQFLEADDFAKPPVLFSIGPASYVQNPHSISFFTNALQLSFAALPAPIVTRVRMAEEGELCIHHAGMHRFVSCEAESVVMVLDGLFLYDAYVSIRAHELDSWPCTTLVGDANSIICVLPHVPTDLLLHQYRHGGNAEVKWDLHVSSQAGSVTLPNALRHTVERFVSSHFVCRSHDSDEDHIHCVPAVAVTRRSRDGDAFGYNVLWNVRSQLKEVALQLRGGEEVVSVGVGTASSTGDELTHLVPLHTAESRRVHNTNRTSRMSVGSQLHDPGAFDTPLWYGLASIDPSWGFRVDGCELEWMNSRAPSAFCRVSPIITLEHWRLNASRVHIDVFDQAGEMYQCSVMDDATDVHVRCVMPEIKALLERDEFEDVLYSVHWRASVSTSVKST